MSNRDLCQIPALTTGKLADFHPSYAPTLRPEHKTHRVMRDLVRILRSGMYTTFTVLDWANPVASPKSVSANQFVSAGFISNCLTEKAASRDTWSGHTLPWMYEICATSLAGGAHFLTGQLEIWHKTTPARLSKGTKILALHRQSL